MNSIDPSVVVAVTQTSPTSSQDAGAYDVIWRESRVERLQLETALDKMFIENRSALLRKNFASEKVGFL